MTQVNLLKFKKLITTVGNLPSSYVESLSYYECILWLCNYLENTVIPALNNNGEAVEELQGLYVDLKEYVDESFEDLNLQEYVDNKLDEMVEDGSLQEVMAEYLNTKALFTFNNVEELKAASNLINGSFARTIGYYTPNDGGDGLYLIRNVTNQDTEDDGAIIALENEELVAELIYTSYINVKQYGAKGDNETDDFSKIEKALIFAKANGLALYFPEAEYIMNGTLEIDVPNFEIYGDGKNKSIIYFNVDDSTCIDLESMGNKLHDFQIYGKWTSTQYAVRNVDHNRSARNVIENIKIRNIQNGIFLENTYNDCNILRNIDFQLVGQCIYILHNDNGIIENCNAEPFSKVFCELHQPNACAIRNCLVNTSSQIFGESNSTAFILTGYNNTQSGQRVGSCVTIENIHSEFIHQFALIGLSDVSIKDVYIWNNNVNSNLNMFHYINYSGNSINNCNLSNIVLNQAPFASGNYGIYKANYSETSVTAANGKNYTCSISKFINLNVNGFNSTVNIPDQLSSGNYSQYTIKNNNVIYSNGSLRLIDNIVTVPDVTAANVNTNYYTFGKAIDDTTLFETRKFVFRYDTTSSSWYPNNIYSVNNLQGQTVTYTPLTKNGIILLSVNAKETGKYSNTLVVMREGVIKNATDLSAFGVTVSTNGDNTAITLTATSYQNPWYITENVIEKISY